ncbi:group II intron reverse transcriptase/maturase [Listeria booriae]|nr:group II intron reverse transcriptase/maturase [Listeria booriae]
MQNAETILSIIRRSSLSTPNYRFNRLYRNLFNVDFYMRAYQKIYAKPGNMTEGIDGGTIDGFKKQWILDIVTLMKEEKYYPQPAKRKYIPKKNGKLRPLGIPTFKDKLVQEVLRQILESVYEPIFDDNSHGFRPQRSCHTALWQVKKTCGGTNWVIEGDIKGCFDNINHERLLSILGKKIEDGRILELIRRFLQAGYFDFNIFHKSISGTPQGGILSPILANIYLHELDEHVNSLQKKYTKGRQRKVNPAYHSLNTKRWKMNKRGNYEEGKQLLKEMQQIHYGDMMDPNFIRVKYVRYADDFLICIIGNKKLASDIKHNVADFLFEHLHLELSEEKTLVTNLKNKRIRFLGYDISKTYDNSIQKLDSIGRKKRSVNGSIQLLVPNEVIYDKLKPFRKYKNKPCSFLARTNLPVLDILQAYNAEIQGFYQYYSLATDVSTKLAKFQYYHYSSLLKTVARKEKSTVNKVLKKYGVPVIRKQGTGIRMIFGVHYETKDGTKTMTYYNKGLRKKDLPVKNLEDCYGLPFVGGQLIKRINANRCEMCGDGKNELDVHHVRKLKDITRKYKKRGNKMPSWVLLMSTIQRKTLIVCESCHAKIHNGTL